jgi:hypothetical protein
MNLDVAARTRRVSTPALRRASKGESNTRSGTRKPTAGGKWQDRAAARLLRGGLSYRKERP